MLTKEEILKYAERLAELEELDVIKEYRQVVSEVVSYPKGEPELEYYKSSDLYDYYIELPYERFDYKYDKYQFIKHNYNYIGKGIGIKKGWTRNACLSLCKYSKEEIMAMIDKEIIEDNEEDEDEL